MKNRAIIKGIVLAIAVSFVMVFAMAVSTSECNAADTKGTTTVFIYCGSGHGTVAQNITDYLNIMGINNGTNYYQVNATRSGTTVMVECPDDVMVGRIRTAITNGINDGDTGAVNENGERLSSGHIGLHQIGYYSNYTEFFNEYFAYKDATVTEFPTFYLLWTRPYMKNIAIEIDVPCCGTMGNEEGPSVRCTSDSKMKFPYNPAVSGDSTEYPVWFLTKPEGTVVSDADFNVFLKYKGKLTGGTQYYACAKFEVPWGYYFKWPNTTITATANGQPADVFDATGGEEYNNIFVGAYITASHPWDDRWQLTTAPTCSSKGEETSYCGAGCGASRTRPVNIDPNAHKWGAWETVTEPRAFEEGLERHVCEYDSSHFEERSLPATGVSGTLLAQAKAKGKTKLNITWTKITGAEGYDVFFAKCNSRESKSKCKLIKTISGNDTFELTKGKLKKYTSYKACVKAFAYKSGEKVYVGTSPTVHVYSTGGTKVYTNPKSVTVNKTAVSLNAGGTFKIKGKVNKLNSKKQLPTKGHGATLRYYSSDKGVATVSSKGVVKAKSTGECKVYVLAINGVRKAITITVE